jgi:hypothetical protein
VAETPVGYINIYVRVMHPLGIVLVRAGRTFLQTFLAVLVGGALGPSVPVVSEVIARGDFLEVVVAAFYVGGVAALITAIWNIGELLARVDQAYPEVRA